MENLPASQPKGFELGPREQEARLTHREWIGGRCYTLLSHYWRDDDEDMLSAAIAKDWADVLEGLPQNYIDRACIRYLREEPKRKPTPGAIYALAVEMMPRPSLVRVAAEPAPPEPSPAQKDADLQKRRDFAATIAREIAGRHNMGGTKE